MQGDKGRRHSKRKRCKCMTMHSHDAGTRDPFTHRSFYTQTLLHTDPFTHRPFYTQTLLHTDAFTHRCLHTQLKSQFYLSFWHSNLVLCVKGSSGTPEIAILPQFFDTRTSFCAWRVHPAHLKSQFYLSVWHSNLVLCVKGSSGTLEIAILPQFFWHSNLVSCERVDVSTRHAWNRNFTSVFDTRTSFCAWRVHPARLKSQFYLSFWHSNLVSCVKGSSATLAIAILPQFWTLEPRFVGKGCNRQLKVAILPQFLTLEPRFVREGFIRTSWKSQFYLSFWHSNLVSCERVDVSWSVVGTARGLKRERRRRREWKGRERQRGEREREREREKRERERERERKRERMWGCEDVKMWRCEDVKMWRCEDGCGCEDVKMCRCEDMRMWRCEDVKMWGCEDVKMWWCEDVKMWRCEDVKLWRCEDVMMWRCESMQIQLLEEPFAQTLSGIIDNNISHNCMSLLQFAGIRADFPTNNLSDGFWHCGDFSNEDSFCTRFCLLHYSTSYVWRPPPPRPSHSLRSQPQVQPTPSTVGFRNLYARSFGDPIGFLQNISWGSLKDFPTRSPPLL